MIIPVLCICVGVIDFVLIIAWNPFKELDKLFIEWQNHMLRHDKYFTDVEWHRTKENEDGIS